MGMWWLSGKININKNFQRSLNADNDDDDNKPDHSKVNTAKEIHKHTEPTTFLTWRSSDFWNAIKWKLPGNEKLLGWWKYFMDFSTIMKS